MAGIFVTSFSSIPYYSMLDIHISRHLARLQFKSLTDLFRSTKSWLTLERQTLNCVVDSDFKYFKYLNNIWHLWDQSHVTIVWNARETGDIDEQVQWGSEYWILNWPKLCLLSGFLIVKSKMASKKSPQFENLTSQVPNSLQSVFRSQCIYWYSVKI